MLAKGSAEFDGNQKDKERHSIVVTVNMPNIQLMDLIAAYNGNTGRTALMTVNTNWYLAADAHDKPQGGEQNINTEVGLVGEEANFKVIGGMGLVPAEAEGIHLFGRIQIHEGAPDIREPAWNYCARSLFEQMLAKSGIQDATVTIFPAYAWGPTTIGQPMCGADVHIQCKEKPQYMRRWMLFPSGKFAHHTFELDSGKIPIVYPAPIHFFTAGEPRGDKWYFGAAPARTDSDTAKAWRNKFAAIKRKHRAKNENLLKPRRSPRRAAADKSPAGTESNKRRRKQAVSLNGVQPTAAAASMAAMSVDQAPTEAEAAAATGAAATSTAEASTAEAGATDTPQQPVAEHMEAAVEDDSAYDVPEAQQEDGEIDEDDDIM